MYAISVHWKMNRLLKKNKQTEVSGEYIISWIERQGSLS